MKGSLDASEGTYREEKRFESFLPFQRFALSLILFVDIFFFFFVLVTLSLKTQLEEV